MAGPRGISIRLRLRLTTLLASGVALSLASFVFLAYDLAYQRGRLLDGQTRLAQVMAADLSSPVARFDQEGSRLALSALRETDALAAAAYTASGRLLARYVQEGSGEAPLPESPPADGSGFEDGALLVVAAIVDGDARVGTIYLRADAAQLRGILLQHAGATGIALLLCVGVAYAMASLLQRAVTRPILSLADAVRAFATDPGSDVRAVKYAEDELGLLVDSFNEMLGRIGQDRELEQRNEELRRDKARFEASARTKTEFLANMSHEIRTPMTAILGYIDLLTDSDLSEKDRLGYHDTVRRNGQHLLDIINDILDLSKIEAGKMQIHRERCGLVEIVDDLVNLMSGRAREKGLEFTLEYPGLVPATIETDPTRLRQILINLLGNAVKFTSQGSVGLSVELLEREDGVSPQLQFRVADTGIGLRYDQIATIFDPFAQADNSTTRQFGGTGLGLAISKRLAESLGGGISVESHEGRGSVFTLVVEIGSVEDVKLVEDPADDLPQRRKTPDDAPRSYTGNVLLAEDGPDNQRLICAFLRRGGFEVAVVENGRRAVEAALAADEAGHPFDVILMDMHMPELDGYGATARLRRAGYERPIVALTAKAMKGNREECLAAGCDDYATKPIDRQSLLELVASYVEKARSIP